MKRFAFLLVFTVGVGLGAFVLAGCGGGGGNTTTTRSVSGKVLAEANGNCRQLRREAVALARGAFDGATNLSEAATKYIIRPSIPLLERFAARQQRLTKNSGDPKFELYGRFFEPIIVLAHERLRSGEESNSPYNTAARGFEILLTTTIDEQRQVAREVGMGACAIDFEKVLRSALGT